MQTAGGNLLFDPPGLIDDASVELVEMGEAELKGLPGEHEIWRVVTR